MTQLKKEKNIKIVVVNKEGINTQDLAQDFQGISFLKL